MNKVINKITLTLVLIGLSVGSFCSAYSLYVKNAEQVTVNISTTIKKYYLCGDFTSPQWTRSDAYVFTDNTSSMTPETDKIAEYLLNDVNIASDKQLRVSDSDDNWYSGYSHCWKKEDVIKVGDNYKTQLTSSKFSFVFKLYNNGGSNLYVRAPKERIYFVPSNDWKGGARFAAYFYNGSSNTWVDFVANGSNYYCDVPSAYQYDTMIFCRMNGSTTENNWDNKWNQSGDISVTYSVKNCCTMPNTWNDWTGSAATWTNI